MTKASSVTPVGSITTAFFRAGRSPRTSWTLASWAAFSQTMTFTSAWPAMYATWIGEFVG